MHIVSCLTMQLTMQFVHISTLHEYSFGIKISPPFIFFKLFITNFIASKNVVVPLYGSIADGSALAAVAAGDIQIFSVDNNTDEKVSAMGVTVGLDTKIDKLDFGATFSYNEFDRSNVDPNFETGFNTPKIRTKFSLGSTELSDDFAFNVSARYHNAYMWESTFMDGMIPAMWTFDAVPRFRYDW